MSWKENHEDSILLLDFTVKQIAYQHILVDNRVVSECLDVPQSYSLKTSKRVCLWFGFFFLIFKI